MIGIYARFINLEGRSLGTAREVDSLTVLDRNHAVFSYGESRELFCCIAALGFRVIAEVIRLEVAVFLEVDQHLRCKGIILIQVAFLQRLSVKADRLLRYGDVADLGNIDVLCVQLSEIVVLVGLRVDQLSVARALTVFVEQICSARGFRLLIAVDIALINPVRVIFQNAVLGIVLRHLHIVARIKEVGEMRRISASERELIGCVSCNSRLIAVLIDNSVGKLIQLLVVLLGNEVEFGDCLDIISETGVDVGVLDFFFNDVVVAERNHGEGHLAVTLQHTAFHIEYGHGVVVVVALCVGCLKIKRSGYRLLIVLDGTVDLSVGVVCPELLALEAGNAQIAGLFAVIHSLVLRDTGV